MRDAGSILIETLVACAILALVLATGIGIVGDAAHRVRRADLQRSALMLARSRLAAAGIETPLAPGTLSGVDGDLRWTETITPFEGAGDSLAGQPLRVQVTAVNAVDAKASVTLATLRLAALR